MKRITKIALLTTGLATSISMFNRHIFNKVNSETFIKTQGNYRSKYGNIAYTKSGEGEPLLLIHGIGIGTSKEEWKHNINTLSKYFQVYTIDLLGFGDSDRPNITYTAYLYVQLINNFIDDVIKQPVHVVASSTSAGFASVAYTFNRDNILSLTFINPTGIGTSLNTADNKDCNIRKLLDTHIIGTSMYNMMSSKNMVRRFLEDEIFYNKDIVSDSLVDIYYNNAHKFGVNNKYVISSFMSNYLNIDLCRFLKDINIPIYIIWGQNNDINPVSNIKYINEVRPDIKPIIFNNSRALPQYENSKAFNNLIIKNLYKRC